MGKAVLDLQSKLPLARVVYASATGGCSCYTVFTLTACVSRGGHTTLFIPLMSTYTRVNASDRKRKLILKVCIWGPDGVVLTSLTVTPWCLIWLVSYFPNKYPNPLKKGLLWFHSFKSLGLCGLMRLKTFLSLSFSFSRCFWAKEYDIHEPTGYLGARNTIQDLWWLPACDWEEVRVSLFSDKIFTF